MFLPVVLLIYYFLIKIKKYQSSQVWLVVSSLFFYGYWQEVYLLLIVGSLIVNYLLGRVIVSSENTTKKALTTIAVLFNISLLAYFKYTNFIVDNINYAFDASIDIENIVLPLAISFFTFQQIAYIVDCYKSESKEYSILQYSLFITFFPQLVAGPIVHHKEMMPQFNHLNLSFNAKNFYVGVAIFSIGLFKKVVIADTFAIFADAGFDGRIELDVFSAWVTSLSYTFQLYFDFSGYCDMAMGLALLFNIKLPINFDSPYKSRNIQEFWRRWHITLGRFLRDYIYIPLGGSRRSNVSTMFNLFLTFLIGGIWHGASWMFIIWGAMHGLALVCHRLWSQSKLVMSPYLAWFITFMFINISWVFFRATDIKTASEILSNMFILDLDSLFNPTLYTAWIGSLPDIVSFQNLSYFILLTAFFATFALVLLAPNGLSLVVKNRVSPIMVSILFTISIIFITSSKKSTFLYFNF